MATSSTIPVKFPVDSSIDWAKLAAFIDGEGHIEIPSKNKGTKASHIKVSIGNTDPRLCRWLQDTFGGYVRRRSVTKGWKIFWQWMVTGRSAAMLLEKCLPHFVMKRDQAEIGIAFGSLVFDRAPKGRIGLKPFVKQVTPEIEEKRAALMFQLRQVREDSCQRVQ